MIKSIVTDIEGTTTSVSFVFDVLFPYAKNHIAEFVSQHHRDDDVKAILDEVVSLSGVDNSTARIIEKLTEWMNEDKKITPLKSLQGMIWESAYQNGDFKGHIYADVPAHLAQWHQQGINLYVYSSGSVSAQKLLFGYSEAGDLTQYFSRYFDTHIGNKRETESYRNILESIDEKGSETLFLSDIEEELDAAQGAGMHTLQLVRSGATASARHDVVTDFAQIDLTQYQ